MSNLNLALKALEKEMDSEMTDTERFEKAKEIAILVDEFKLFVMDSIIDGSIDPTDDDMRSLEICLEVFKDLKA